jgi:HEAT repeat protein
MATEPDSEARVPAVVERFVRQLIVADKAVSLYPPSSAIPRDTARDAVTILDEALRESPEVRFTVTRDGLYYEGLPVFPGHHTFVAFAREFYNRMLAEVRFHSGTDPSDLIAFLTVLNYPSDELAEAGGFEARLWEQNVGTISVTESKITLIDAEPPAFIDESEALTVEEVDELVSRARRGGAGEQITIARFMSNPAAVRNYLSQTMLAGGASGFDRMTDSFVKLAHLASTLTGGDVDEHMRSLAEAALQLAEEVRAELVTERLLPEARSSAPVAAVVRQMDIDQLCRMFASGVGAGDLRVAMVRAIRNLSAVSGIDHDAVVRAAGGVLLEQGFEPPEVESIIAEASPSQLSVSDASGAAFSRPNDAVIQLIDSAPVSAEVQTRDPEILALKEEARRGITDGDVIGALVTLVTLDSSEHSFDVTMTRLENAISLLIERGELEAAAEVSVTLGTAAKNPELTEEQRHRIVRAIARFACSEDLKAIVQALRLYPPGSGEHTAALKLIKMLGPLALKPLLEQLADEPDMAARKSLVDTIGGMASSYIPELGEEVADPRWYFVRNVVSILGSTKSPTVLPYLERTLRYPEPRVRRETIRALSLQGDRLASEMLVHCLYDDDAQNVQLAARFVGQRGVATAVPTLEQVARGEGRGNREIGPRVEAIEALGRLGAVEAMPTLRMLAGRRALLRGAKARELRSAALGAIQRIEFLEGVK